ncbi:hypothetical protein AB0202_27200, partial [Klebsiella quasipneumoniae]|uniref:hypothetical protein n=1 Tax=Klebsiella quasipneumoniae TaxID=1463165 RepID=UPI00344C67C7
TVHQEAPLPLNSSYTANLIMTTLFSSNAGALRLEGVAWMALVYGVKTSGSHFNQLAVSSPGTCLAGRANMLNRWPISS